MKKLLLAAIVLIAVVIGFVHVFPERALQAEFARQRLLAGAEVHYRTVDGERWPYLEAGQGELIVLVHGYTGSKENWLPVMGKLAEKHRVIAVDLPGWGESVPKAGQDYGPVAQAARLSAFLKTQAPQTALLVGHSMGGMISGLMTAEHPEQVQRIVFMSSAGVVFTENEFARRVQKGGNPFAVYETAAFQGFLSEFVFADAPYVPAPMAGVIVAQREAKKDFEQTVFTQIRTGPEAFLLQARLPGIAQPAGLLWCDQDRIIDPSAAAVFAKGLKKSTTKILAGCGHMPMMEQPGQVAEFLLAQF
ncbi:MAG TPA: alpha/beta fold hydrolase [Arenimonas sp.]|nr:alpha/beta fold hydrolase [Arenimonas sp.]